ncbi:ADP-ribosylation factor-binding protein GGA3 isoform X2 [Chelonus insularis]|uniref:ADP-ribosylation factor-binding protein GGA3 isoform X2 n=1 Tax=Chelonus insularis TaxID=460826 RepID=UPI00158D82CD|nr:ADP-ribosylation factor-binding protein GGA3 isoform X2 [Chelonus insularis]
MDVIGTILEILIQRAINPKNQEVDAAAVDGFCSVIGKEKDGPQVASKLLATHIQSTNEAEALLALNLLDTCMKRCGKSFHAEIGKFRFLNEMIKLVSPKYLGSATPNKVRQKILELLFNWTMNYPKETKIKEAYEMLKNQGVVKDEPPLQIEANNRDKSKLKNSLFEDEETAKLLKELLQSKDPFELQLANRLIKSMVKDDENRVQRSSQTNFEVRIESVRNNAKLLSEMLDSYNPKQTSSEDNNLMKELYQACENFKPTLLKLAEEIQDNENLLDQVLTVNDELSQVFEKYSLKMNSSHNSNNSKDDALPLLDFSSSQDNVSENEKLTGSNLLTSETTKTQTDMDLLTDIFKCMEKPANDSLQSQSDSDLLCSDTDIMQPLPILPSSKESSKFSEKPASKPSALEELNNISKSMLKQDLNMCNTSLKNLSDLLNNLDLKSKDDKNQNSISEKDDCDVLNTVNLLENNIPQKDIEKDVKKICEESKPINQQMKSLMDIHVTLEDVKPSSIPPMTVIDDKNNVTVVLHVAEGSPNPLVSVVVITTMSRSLKPLSNYMFQAVVPENCKCRLQSPSRTELPAYNSFLPPSAITQIMLIGNPKKVPVSVKFMLSYTLDDETFTEMGEIEKLFNL